MPVTELRIKGYRSIRDLVIPLKPVNVIVGANGCGKSNLYQSIVLLHAAAQGRLANTLAAEGGMPSVLWAGSRKEGPVRMELGATLDGTDYDLVLGLPGPSNTMFGLDPLVKEERVTERGRKAIKILERNTNSCNVRDAQGERNSYTLALSSGESVLSQIVDPYNYPHLSALRNKLTSWRFYHSFRTDADSPIRLPQVGVRTRVMASDGHDLAPALQTILENGDDVGLRMAIQDAFPGAELAIGGYDGRFEVAMHFPGLHRHLQARELSDGTLRYLCLLAALMSPNPAPLLALNEPETSLHPELIPPLGRLIAKVSGASQIWVTTHSRVLAETLEAEIGVRPIALAKVNGETQRAGRPANVYYSVEYDG
jgi:predicted ATPase